MLLRIWLNERIHFGDARRQFTRLGATSFIHTCVHDKPVQPSGKICVAPEPCYAVQHFQEHLLGYIACGRPVSVEKVQGDRVHLILVGFVESTKGVSIALAARLDDVSGDLAIDQTGHHLFRRTSPPVSSNPGENSRALENSWHSS